MSEYKPTYKADGEGNITLGQESQATGSDCVVIGSFCEASCIGGVAVGAGSTADEAGSVAIGFNSEAKAVCSVAIGSSSVADVPDTVSVGGGAGSITETRRIVNVSPGRDKNDAVTMVQLSMLEAVIGELGKKLNFALEELAKLGEVK